MVAYFNLDVGELGVDLEDLGIDELREALQEAVYARYDAKEERLGSDLMRMFERDIMLRVVDQSWKDHLLALDHLKEGIGLRGYGQRDPKQEYKRESYEAFSAMKERIEDTVIKTLFRLEPLSEEQIAERRQQQRDAAAGRLRFTAPPKSGAPQRPQTVKRSEKKIGRNDPCPCGSGKKYKKCHGSPAKVSA